MATVTRENIGLLTDKLTVQVSKEDYYQAFEQSLKKLSKDIKLPGFREGKVPVGMIKKMHGQAVFSDEVVRSIENGLYKFLVDEKLDIFGQALPAEGSSLNGLDFNNPTEYSFSFEIGLRPEFELPALKEIKLPEYKIQITDDLVEEEVERHRLRTGKMTEIEETNDEYDVLQLKFTEADADGKPVQAAAEAGAEAEAEAEGKTISVLVKYFSEKGRAALKGKKLNDTVVLSFGEAFEGKEKDWMARDLGIEGAEDADAKKYLITLTKLEHVDLSEFNEEFFKAAYPNHEIADEAAFREVVKKEIEDYWATQAKNHLEHEVYHILIDETKIDFPEEFLKRWLKENPSNKSETNADDPAEFKKFLNGLKWSLITDKISTEQKLEITQEELRKEALNQLMGYMGMNQGSSEEPWIKDYLDRVMKDERFIAQTEEKLFTSKILSWAAEQVQAKTTEVSIEEFSNLIKAHNHQHH